MPDEATSLEEKINSNKILITVDDRIQTDDDMVKSNDATSKSKVDHKSNTEQEEEHDNGEESKLQDDEEQDEEIKSEQPLPSKKAPNTSTTSTGPKSIIVATTTNNNVIQNKIVTATTTSPGFVKIAPRSGAIVSVPQSTTINTISTSATAARTSNGKIIYLQRSSGATVPVRVPGTITANTSTTSLKPTVAIQLIRTPEGNLVPLKGGKSISIPNVSQLAGKKIITTTAGATSGQMVIKAPIKTISGPIMQGGSMVSTPTTVGSTIISPIEGSKPKVRQFITPKPMIASANNGSGKMLMQTSSGTRQVMVSQNLIKLSPYASAGQLQAIQIPGKPGLQYVRVINNTPGVTHKIATPETVQKYTVIQQTKSPMKTMVKSPLKDRDRQKIMTTVPTFRKINEVVIKPDEKRDGSYARPHKISQINSQIRRFSNIAGPGTDAKSTTPSSKYIDVSKSLIRSTVTSQNQKIMQQRQLIQGSQPAAATSLGPQSPPPAKKLFSVLRPLSDYKEVKLKARAEPVPSKPPAPTLMSVIAVERPMKSSPPPSDDSGVTIRRKHCNCTKSQCLKLYCDCFANGEFCQDCNCKDCLNNLDNEDERQKAIRNCLERNPNSFKPKITTAKNESDQRLHNKGCNCKRSGCLKNYCECYEAKISCSSNCKCVGCRNVDDHPDLDMDVKKCPIPTIQTSSRVKRSYDDMVKPRTTTLQPSTSSSASISAAAAAAAAAASAACSPSVEKQPCNFITQEVVDATIQCLIAQADECKKGSLTPYQTEKMVMEELGRCLVEIIDFSIRNTDQN